DLVRAQPERRLPELAAGADVAGEEVDVVEAADVRAAPGVGLVVGGDDRAALGRSGVALCAVVEAEDVSVGVGELVPGADAAVGGDPAAPVSVGLEPLGAAQQGAGAPGAPGDPGGFGAF